jgi:tetratricopeptide (TPR) repeat protein
VESQEAVASNLHNIGEVRMELGRPGEALEAFERSAVSWERLTASHPTVPFLQLRQGWNLVSLGDALIRLGRLTEARAALTRAQGILESLTRAHPEVWDYQHVLADGLRRLGEVLARTGQPAEALGAWGRARAIGQALVQAHPDVVEYRAVLADVLCRIGEQRRADGRPAEAADVLRSSIAQWEHISTLAAERQYRLACAHALLSALGAWEGSGVAPEEARAEADRAMTWLRQAVAAGYRNRAELERATELDSLRTRPDFPLLLMDFALPADPFAPAP